MALRKSDGIQNLKKVHPITVTFFNIYLNLNFIAHLISQIIIIIMAKMKVSEDLT